MVSRGDTDRPLSADPGVSEDPGETQASSPLGSERWIDGSPGPAMLRFLHCSAQGFTECDAVACTENGSRSHAATGVIAGDVHCEGPGCHLRVSRDPCQTESVTILCNGHIAVVLGDRVHGFIASKGHDRIDGWQLTLGAPGHRQTLILEDS